MSKEDFILGVFVFTIIVHIGLLFMRGWLIGQVRREMRKMQERWERWKYDQEQRFERFEEEHKSPWHQKKTRA